MSLNGVSDFAFLGDVDPACVDLAAVDYGDHWRCPGCFDATLPMPVELVAIPYFVWANRDPGRMRDRIRTMDP